MAAVLLQIYPYIYRDVPTFAIETDNRIMTDLRNELKTLSRQDELIALTYRRMYGQLKGYVLKRIGCVEDAEDIVQNVFETLLRPGLLISEQTITRYVYTIAHNLVVDWMRHHACREKAREFFAEYFPHSVEDTDSRVNIGDINKIEMKVLERTGEKGARIYMMHVYGAISVKDIAESTGTSGRTVENHIFRTRKRVREALKEAL